MHKHKTKEQLKLSSSKPLPQLPPKQHQSIQSYQNNQTYQINKSNQINHNIHNIQQSPQLPPKTKHKPLPQLPPKQNEIKQENHMNLPHLTKYNSIENEPINFENIYSKAQDLCFMFSSVIEKRKQQQIENKNELLQLHEKLSEETKVWKELISVEQKSNENEELRKQTISWIGKEINNHQMKRKQYENNIKHLEKRMNQIDIELNQLNNTIRHHLVILNELTIVSMMNNVKQSLYSESIEIVFASTNSNNNINDEYSQNKKDFTLENENINENDENCLFKKRKFDVEQPQNPNQILQQQQNQNNQPKQRELTSLEKEIIEKNTTIFDKAKNALIPMKPNAKKGYDEYISKSKQINEWKFTPFLKTTSFLISEITSITNYIPIVRKVSKPIHYCASSVYTVFSVAEHGEDVDDYLNELFEVYENEKKGGGKAYAISRASARMTKDFVGSVVIPSLLPFDEEWLEIK